MTPTEVQSLIDRLERENERGKELSGTADRAAWCSRTWYLMGEAAAALRWQQAEIGSLRELLTIHNLGGWTDAHGLLKRAEKAEAERDAAIKRAEIAEGEVDLYAEQVDELKLPILFGAEHGRAWYEAVQESIDAAMKAIEAAKAMRKPLPDAYDVCRAFDAALAKFEHEQRR